MAKGCIGQDGRSLAMRLLESWKYELNDSMNCFMMVMVYQFRTEMGLFDCANRFLTLLLWVCLKSDSDLARDESTLMVFPFVFLETCGSNHICEQMHMFFCGCLRSDGIDPHNWRV